MLKKRIRSRNENFLNPTAEISEIYEELLGALEHEKGLININDGVAGHGVVFAHEDGDLIIRIDGWDDNITIRTGSVLSRNTKTVIKTKKDFYDWLDWLNG